MNAGIVTPEVIEAAQVIRQRPAYERCMRDADASRAQKHEMVAHNVIVNDEYKPAVMDPIATVAAKLGCSNEQAIITVLEAVPA